MHGGGAPQVKAKARERFAAARDASLAKYVMQLEDDLVTPPTTYAAARDYAKLVMDMDQQVASAESGSALDTFLDWLRKSA